MKKLFLVLILIFTFYLLFSNSVLASPEDDAKIAQLRQQIEALEQQAQQYKDGIASERAKGQSLQREITILKDEIKSIATQIQLTSKKIDKTKIEITGLEANIFDTQAKIDRQKAGIGRLVLFLNQIDKEDILATLIKNRNLSDFFDHRQYAADVSSKLVSLIGELNNTKLGLEDTRSNLEGKKQELEVLNREQAVKKASLGDVEHQKTDLLTTTKGEEAQYQKMLTEVEIQEANFFSQLRELETHVIQGGLYIVHIQAIDLPRKKTNLFQWPEEGYHVTQGYGCTRYARCGRTRGPYNGAPHNGIDMAAGYGSQIMAIADGEIVANGKNDGWGNWVAIRHPDQYNLVSLYAHMSALSFLQVGTKVHAGDVIGYEGNTGHAEGSHLHLSLYKDFFTYINDKKDQLYFNYFEGTVNPLDYL